MLPARWERRPEFPSIRFSAGSDTGPGPPTSPTAPSSSPETPRPERSAIVHRSVATRKSAMIVIVAITNTDGSDMATASGTTAVKPITIGLVPAAHRRMQVQEHKAHQQVRLIRLGFAGVADQRLGRRKHRDRQQRGLRARLQNSSRENMKEGYTRERAKERNQTDAGLGKSDDLDSQPFQCQKTKRTNLAVRQWVRQVGHPPVEQIGHKHRLVAPHRVIQQPARRAEPIPRIKKAVICGRARRRLALLAGVHAPNRRAGVSATRRQRCLSIDPFVHRIEALVLNLTRTYDPGREFSRRWSDAGPGQKAATLSARQPSMIRIQRHRYRRRGSPISRLAVRVVRNDDGDSPLTRS